MREKKTIREQIETPAKSVATVLLFFGALLVVLWGIIALTRFVLG
jgi:hypothetical protein